MKMSNRKNVAEVALFSAILVVCAFVSIPAPVPFTMQTFGVFLSAVLLGSKKGSLVVLIYLLLGAIGLPVFSGARAGIGTIFGQTGGYITGFLPAAFLTGKIFERTKKSPLAMAFSMVLGLLCVYIVGSLWFSLAYFKNAKTDGFIGVISVSVLPFIIPDLLKIGLAVYTAKGILKFRH